MHPNANPELSTIERTAIVTAVLLTGGTVTPEQVAILAKCSLRNAYYLLEAISRVVPIRDEAGKWFAVGQNQWSK